MSPGAVGVAILSLLNVIPNFSHASNETIDALYSLGTFHLKQVNQKSNDGNGGNKSNNDNESKEGKEDQTVTQNHYGLVLILRLITQQMKKRPHCEYRVEQIRQLLRQVIQLPNDVPLCKCIKSSASVCFGTIVNALYSSVPERVQLLTSILGQGTTEHPDKLFFSSSVVDQTNNEKICSYVVESLSNPFSLENISYSNEALHFFEIVCNIYYKNNIILSGQRDPKTK